ncbi:hypothetical protein Tco_1206781 [Tanacetum coccineum]
MDLFSQLRSADSLNRGKSSGLGIGFGSEMVLNNDMLSNNISLENPSVAFSGDARYMAPLWVSGKADELSQPDPSQSATTSCFELMDGDMDSHNQIVNDKTKAALKLLTFREDRVLVQFWRPHDVGKQQLLTTIDQPYGLGAINEEFYFYRKDSERNAYVIDKDHEEEEDDLSPPARVFKKGSAEWTSDVTNYLPEYFPQQECAARCGLHGYLALPVFDTSTRSCIGVLELLTCSKYPNFAYEVQQFEKALKVIIFSIC